MADTLDLQCKDTIAALLTGSSDGVVAVVRISGPDAVRVRERVFRKRRPGPFRAATLHRGDVMEDGRASMEALCATFPGTASFTGEPCVEIQGYGGRINAERLLARVLACGARLAQPGEFSLRAFLHGRMGLDQAEAVAGLLTAQSTQAAREAERLRHGVLARALEPLREGMLALLAETEAHLDFPEDGLPESRRDAQRMLCLEMADTLRGLQRGGDRLRRMLEGARVVLWGAPNAGKSTLLNALCGEPRAIVDEQPGTTRDVVEVHLIWDGMPITLVDTAGVRVGGNRVEEEGIRRSHAEADRADLVLCCVSAEDAGTGFMAPPGKRPVLVVETKNDLASAHGAAPGAARRLGAECLPVSAQSGEGLPALRAQVLSMLGGGTRPHDGTVVATARQADLLDRSARALRECVRARDATEPEEVAAQWLRIAAEALGEVSGRAMPPEEVLGAIFGRFCIGK
jgi:tRNA modification GTPase